MYAELAAIDAALSLVSSSRCPHAIIVTDSSSALMLLQRQDKSTELQYFRRRYLEASSNCNIQLAWIPGHAGIYLNERADSLAKRALRLALNEAALPECVYLPKVLCAIAGRQLTYGLPRQIVDSLENKHQHLRWEIPPRSMAIYRPLMFEWCLLRLRINRPAIRIKDAIFGDRNGNCHYCPDTPLSSLHLIAECPTFLTAQTQLQTDICNILHLPVATLECILSHGRNLNADVSKSDLIAQYIKDFFQAILIIASQ